MKLKVPPVFVFLCFGTFMYLLSKFLPVGFFNFFGRHYLTVGLVLIAIIIVFVSLLKFYREKTTIDPTKPSKTAQLVTSGVYAYTRNPMYLGMLLVLLAWGIWLGNAFNILLTAGFVIYMNKFQIIPEELALLKIFGKTYSRYCSLVRRWF